MRTLEGRRQALGPKSQTLGRRMWRSLKKYYQIYLLILPAMIYIGIFCYVPMYGVQIAFKDFSPTKGFWGSQWVGLKYFQMFFEYYNVWQVIWNTLSLSLYSLIIGFPIPILLAIMINEARCRWFKKTVQMVTYAPHFISTVVICGMLSLFLNKDFGLFNHIIEATGGQRFDFMTSAAWYKTLYVLSSVWQTAGWGTIIYLAALSGVSTEVLEAARIDGASRMRKIWHIDLPTLRPTIVILFVLNCGNIMSVGFEKAILMQNSLNMPSSDIISTYVYRMGILGAQHSYSTAIGLFNNIINIILIVLVNSISKRLTKTSIW